MYKEITNIESLFNYLDINKGQVDFNIVLNFLEENELSEKEKKDLKVKIKNIIDRKNKVLNTKIDFDDIPDEIKAITKNIDLWR